MRTQIKPYTVLGIDASLTATGLCLLTENSFNERQPSTTTLRNKLKGVPRLLYIEKNIEEWAKDADVVVLEGYAYGRRYKNEVLGELQGVIKRLLYLMDKKVLIVRTQEVKEILTGRVMKPKKIELNTKKWTILETKKNYKIDFKNEDNECDAFGLALIGLFLNKDPQKLNVNFEFVEKAINKVSKYR